jgi:hypothetical protein
MAERATSRAYGRLGGNGWLFSRRYLRMDISPLYAAVATLMEVEQARRADDVHIY